MSNKTDLSQEYRKQGYNCAQAVVGCFSKEMGMDLVATMKLASTFGGGMGQMHEVCGVVSGVSMVLGMVYGNNSPKDLGEKKAQNQRVRTLADQFRDLNGHIVCRELLATPNRKSCNEFVAQGVALLEAYIENNPV